MVLFAILIFTYNSTGILEFSSRNSPFLVLLDYEIEPINDSAIKFFKEYIDVGIIHLNTKSLLSHLNLIYNDIDLWWFSEKVQKAVKNFSNNFSKSNPNIVNDICKTINNLSN